MTSIGIDVSKDQLDVAVRPNGRRFTFRNDEEGRRKLCKEVKRQKPDCVVLEPTGGYETLVVQALAAAKLPVVVVNARQIRQFAQASGRLAKTDAIDADVIAHFGEALHPEVRPIPDEKHRELSAIVSRRRQLVDMRAAEIKRKQTAPSVVQPSVEEVIVFLSKQIDDIDKDIHELLRSTPAWRETDDLLRSVPGVGGVLSTTLVALVPELGTLGNKKIASLIGVAPLNDDSGKRAGKRSTWGGRAPVRAVLYMAALAAKRFNARLAGFYNRLIENGKPPKLAIVACMRKLLVILNAIVRDRQPWNSTLLGPNTAQLAASE